MVDGVDPVYIVDVPVAVIIQTVPGDLTRVPPHVGRQIWVAVGDARIYVSHHDRGRAAAEVVPRRLSLDLLYAPEAAVKPVWVVRRRGGGDVTSKVRLGVCYLGVAPECAH